MALMACVRCGTAPRSNPMVSSFCDTCRPDGIREAKVAEAAHPLDLEAQRQFLLDPPYSWAGWSIRLRRERAA